jgi:sterol desaturase/sphingolipid hydroxylase (fatty acid hydroxylase superfamily)
MVLLAQSWSLIYQFGLHTERIGRLARPIEFVFNTPSHHRVHHGSNEQYLDRNYGGILIIWDRMFGTFAPEGDRVRYGLTKNIETFRPLAVAFGEYAALWHDLRAVRSWRTRVALLFRGPGWRPPGEDISEPVKG